MQKSHEEHRHEALVASLCEDQALHAYKSECDDCAVGFLPRMLGSLLVFLGNTFYGKEPSYEKFKAVEVIARIPYQSWEVASYTLLTALYSNERKAIELSKTSSFSRVAQDNETMHVVVLSQIVKRELGNKFFLHTLIPLVFSFFYFNAIFFLYLFSPRSALELNYLFEDHAFHQYDRFLKTHGEALKKKSVGSDFLAFYGRHPKSEYELFLGIRNDEIIHRNSSMHRARALRAKSQGAGSA